ncbi:TPA: oligosaccharide flippase family protein [Proteus mirabilis]
MKDKLTIFLCYGVNFIIPILFFRFISERLDGISLASFFFHLAIIFYFQYVIEYGFQVSLIKFLFKIKNNKKRINIIVSSVIYFRLFLFLLTCLIVSLFFYILAYDKSFLYIYLILIGNIFSFQFLYQIFNELKVYYILSLLSKLLFLPLIFSSDNIITLYIFFNIIPNLILFTFITKKYKIFFLILNIHLIFKIAKNKFSYFVSNLSITLYTNFNQIILGLFHPLALPAYALADKIIRSIVAGNYIFVQICQIKFLDNINLKNKKLRNKFITLFFTLGIVELFFLVSLSYPINKYLFPNIHNINIFIIILSFLLPIILMSNLYGMVFLTCSNKTKLLSRVFFSAATIAIITSPFLIYFYAGFGALIASIIAELIVLILCMKYYSTIFGNRNA